MLKKSFLYFYYKIQIRKEIELQIILMYFIIDYIVH